MSHDRCASRVYCLAALTGMSAVQHLADLRVAPSRDEHHFNRTDRNNHGIRLADRVDAEGEIERSGLDRVHEIDAVAAPPSD